MQTQKFVLPVHPIGKSRTARVKQDLVSGFESTLAATQAWSSSRQ
jgi:hypothetical protein